MTDKEKTTSKEFPSFCEGMPFAAMMQKMMEAKKAGHSFDGGKMMSQMMQMCCPAREKKEGPARETKETPAPNP